MSEKHVLQLSASKAGHLSNPEVRPQTLSYFILTVLGFSFWFFVAVPFASHRESYSWLAGFYNQTFVQEFSFGLSSTYRPLAQVVTWLAFVFLDPRVFPTSVLRQALLQGTIYGLFVVGWWLVYSGAPQRRLFALIACVVGGVFFSGYVHLFHIYGMFYVPVVLVLGALLRFNASNTFSRREIWFAVVAMLLVFWHPFATALFIGFYFGHYLDTFWQRSREQHVQAIVILLFGMMAILAVVVLFPRIQIPFNTKILGFLASYRTNEFNWFASIVAFLLAETILFSMAVSPIRKSMGMLILMALSVLMLLKSLPILLVWFGAVMIKLLRSRCWSLFFLMLTAAMLPFGGGTGTPIHVLFAIIVAVYVTPLGWLRAENALTFVKLRPVLSSIITAAVLVVMLRAGFKVPVLTKVANPLLAERERTYQLESLLASLHDSDYCGSEVSFVENSGSPVDDLQSAILRRNRPPAALPDVQLFWDTVLRCDKGTHPDNKVGTAVVTFGGQVLSNSTLILERKGRYAGNAAVWIRESPLTVQQIPPSTQLK